MHQGEEGDPVKVIDAIEQLGAERIGHGIQIIKNPSVLQYVKEKDVVLEVCPTRYKFSRLQIPGIPNEILTL